MSQEAELLQRLARIERTLGTLIAWLHGTLGAQDIKILHDMLHKKYAGPPPCWHKRTDDHGKCLDCGVQVVVAEPQKT